MWIEPQTSFSRCWCVTTLPACCASTCSSRYSFGVSVMRAPLSVTARAARSIVSGPTVTPKEYRLLQVLAQHAGNVVTHQHLLKEVWGSIHMQDTHYLRIFVRKLRQKIEPHPDSPKILVTELGVGYRLAHSGAETDPAAAATARAET